MVADRDRIVSKRFEWFALPISRLKSALAIDNFRAISESHKIAPQSHRLCRERGAKFRSFSLVAVVVMFAVKVVVILAHRQIHKLVVDSVHYAVGTEVMI